MSKDMIIDGTATRPVWSSMTYSNMKESVVNIIVLKNYKVRRKSYCKKTLAHTSWKEKGLFDDNSPRHHRNDKLQRYHTSYLLKKSQKFIEKPGFSF